MALSPVRRWSGWPLSSPPLKSAFYLVFWLVLCFSAAAVGAQFTPGAWYASLAKPAWNPPGWIFGPVWTVLYTMMAVAAWLVSTHGEWRRRRTPLTFFCLQLAANAAWSWLFFGRQQPGWALVDMLVLWVLLSVTTGLFLKTRRLAGMLLIPYWLWVSFAALLNAELWRLNG